MPTSFWQLNSNSGHESVRWEVREATRSRHGTALVCDIQLTGQYFGATLGDDASHLPDYSLLLKGLAIGVPELERLSDYLNSWLQLPLTEQARHPPALECNVGGLFDQSLVMSLGRRDDIISAGKPVATFRYIVGRLKGEFFFVTDQSCLLRMAEGLDASLKSGTTSNGAS